MISIRKVKRYIATLQITDYLHGFEGQKYSYVQHYTCNLKFIHLCLITTRLIGAWRQMENNYYLIWQYVLTWWHEGSQKSSTTATTIWWNVAESWKGKFGVAIKLYSHAYYMHCSYVYVKHFVGHWFPSHTESQRKDMQRKVSSG